MKFSFSGHVFRRMAERGFSPDTIESVIESGTVIKSYPDDTPYPSRLILGFDGVRPVHVVSAYNSEDDTEYVITVYEPDPLKWSNDFSKRR
ncbi:MAG: DUF4258 domain-containing protein [Treponema sp.]|uniref:DUF4258 domain-containing protein n=1 Tax=Treponema sp. TaxID=166 RepID=UPI0025F5BDFF|nr:DUF4258 domain-containing protein [Treponema sp.]MBQ8681055.1 DUF4258 domain-containing protein [Treponema sp.]MBR1614510.1 DUF4258 domain-containing protein [Treponema sp.]